MQVDSLCYKLSNSSYTIPTRAVWDLLPEPEGEGNKSHAARGVWYNYFKAYYGNATALL